VLLTNDISQHITVMILTNDVSQHIIVNDADQ